MNETVERAEAGAGRRVVTHVTSLSELVGGHPDALASIYSAGKPCVASDLGDAPEGQLLAITFGTGAFMGLRPIVRAIAAVSPWKGKTFDHGGNGGTNVVLGKKTLRFHAEVGPSALDGKPTLILRYDQEAFGNPRPFRSMVGELRSIAPGLAVGPLLYPGKGGALVPVLYYGLQR